MFDDTKLAAADERVANIFRAAMEKSKKGAGIIYQDALLTNKRFNLVVDVEKSPDKDYFGYTDIVYTDTTDSFLFTAKKKFDVLAAAHGLSLRIVINLAHADTPGQMLSTLVHEVGVHATRLWAAMLPFNRPLTELKNFRFTAKVSEKDLEGILAEQLNGNVYSAEFHHTEFGEGAAEDYNELKQTVRDVLTELGDGAYVKAISFVTGDANPWLTLLTEFERKTAAGEKGHEQYYWHPKVQYEKLLKVAADVEQSALEFATKSKSLRGGLLAWLGIDS